MKSIAFGSVSVSAEQYQYHFVSSRTPAMVKVGLMTEDDVCEVQIVWRFGDAMDRDLLKVAEQINALNESVIV
jgi:hypothetical protein